MKHHSILFAILFVLLGVHSLHAQEVGPQLQTDIAHLIHYPERARMNGIEGKVLLNVLIGKDGSVIKVEIKKSDDTIFNAEAIRVMMLAKYSPAMLDGKLTKAWMEQPIAFKLHSAPYPIDSVAETYSKVLSLSLEGVRKLCAMIGDVREEKNGNDVHLLARSADGKSHDQAPSQIDAIVDQQGITVLTLSYLDLNEVEFNQIANQNGNEEDAKLEIPGGYLRVKMDRMAHTIKIMVSREKIADK